MATIKRRDFLKTLAATGAVAMTGCGGVDLADQISGAPAGGNPDSETSPPNIVLVLVDEMRYPVHFPSGINNADEFLARFMPNLHRHLWTDGVKFSNFRVAAGACTPSRGVLLTGMYSHQSWLVTTITGGGIGGDVPPSLSPEYPTYGSLLQAAGYDTPYFGKFHVSADAPYDSDQCPTTPANYLAPWGFDDCLCPDPGGTQGQGAGANGLALGDSDVADRAVAYFGTKRAGDAPFCATVSFVNPHDYEFFWGGTEPSTYEKVFADAGQEPLIPYDTRIQVLSDPAPQGFPELPSNWESFQQIQSNKPPSQAMFNESSQVIFSGCAFDRSRTDFECEPSQCLGGRIFKGTAPFDYWQRGQDSYTQVLNLVDQQIGRVLEAIPEEVRANTVIVFTSDHGDHVGSHGFLTGKVGTVYDEVLRVPLIVRDHTGRFASETGAFRQQLTSSVDLVRMLVTLGYNGSDAWLQGELEELYGPRHDLLSVVQSSQAPGRDVAVYTTDEFVQRVLNFNASPTHIVGLVRGTEKLGIYNHWAPGTTVPVAAGRTLEFYDHATTGGAAELDNRPDDPRAQELLQLWENEILPGEVELPIPASLRQAQEATRQAYLEFVGVRDDIDIDELLDNFDINRVRDLLPNGFGLDRLPS
jgi:uncharacterized sulfatase